jgi:hypothetical protein
MKRGIIKLYGNAYHHKGEENEGKKSPLLKFEVSKMEPEKLKTENS